MLNRRIFETIRYDDIQQMESIVPNVKSMLVNHLEIARANDSSVDFFVYTFTKTTEGLPF